jgi:hypothetical protein
VRRSRTAVLAVRPCGVAGGILDIVAASVKDRTLVAPLLVLTGVTGLIDAVGHPRLGHLFVANTTGKGRLSASPGQEPRA